MRWILTILPVLTFAAIVLALAMGGRSSSLDTVEGWRDRPLPAFQLPPLAGLDQGLNDAEIRGQVALVNVFASWCGPCRIEHPMLMELAQKNAVPLYGINWRDAKGAGQQFLEQNGNPFRATGADRDGSLREPLEVFAIPRTFVIDRNGYIRYVHVGPITPRDWKDVLQPLVETLEKAS